MDKFIEKDCTIEHQGRQFTSGGAVVTDQYLVAYPDKGGELKDWHGNVLGTWRVIGSRPAVFFGYRSWQGSTYYYMRARVGGREYSLRGFGVGMIARGKAVS
jgi:hypothetical protein